MQTKASEALPSLLDGRQKKVVKIAIGLPFYDGPDAETTPTYLEMHWYLGRLQQYTLDRDIASSQGFKLENVQPEGVFPLDIQPGDPRFEFLGIGQLRHSLIGAAREIICQNAVNLGADYVFMFDDDMDFDSDIPIRLWRNQVPVCGALAFTAREPIAPVIFNFQKRWDIDNHREAHDVIPVMDYQRDQLFQVDAFGTGACLISCDVFRTIPRPWFQSTGCGEDIFFCCRCLEYGIPVYVDSRIKTRHKPTFHAHWHDEEYYQNARKLVSGNGSVREPAGPDSKT